jgi:hypothetical protein
LHGFEKTDELFGMNAHNLCMTKIFEKEWKPANSWCFERYNCPRYTTPEENGKVTLDYCVYLS